MGTHAHVSGTWTVINATAFKRHVSVISIIIIVIILNDVYAGYVDYGSQAPVTPTLFRTAHRCLVVQLVSSIVNERENSKLRSFESLIRPEITSL